MGLWVGREGNSVFLGCSSLYFSQGPSTTSGLAVSVGLTWALSEPPLCRCTISARCMFVPIKTETSGRGAGLPDWSTSEIITSTDNTAALSNTRKWVIFLRPWQREASPQIVSLPCRNFQPTNGEVGWEGRGEGADRSKPRDTRPQILCSHPRFGIFIKNKGFCGYYTLLSHFQSTEMFVSVSFIELYSYFLQRRFSDCLTWL